MATTTSNFSWPIPQSTDLVKDGATAIASLGSGIDTSMVDLKGGTTGQILSKTSNTDMDFTWINNDQGDITGVTAGTGLTGGGTSGSVTLDFDVANYGGGQYAAGKNKIINGDFAINQRNTFTSTNPAGYVMADRWVFSNYVSGTNVCSMQSFTPGTAPVTGYEAQYFARFANSGQSSASQDSILIQKIEDVRTFANQTITVSFWAKCDVTSKKVAVEMVQNFGSGGSPSASVNTYFGQVTLTTSWARYSVTGTIPSISGKTIGTTANTSSLQLFLWNSAGSDYNSRTGSLGIQNNTFDFWGVQLETGSTATPFQTATGTIQGELAACQRYYWRNTATDTISYFGFGTANTTTHCFIQVKTPVTMRTAPSSVDYSTLQVYDGNNTSAVSALSLVSNHQSKEYFTLDATVGAATQYRPYFLVANSSTSAYVGFNAEL